MDTCFHGFLKNSVLILIESVMLAAPTIAVGEPTYSGYSRGVILESLFFGFSELKIISSRT